MKKKSGYVVHSPHTPEGMNLLALHGLTVDDLNKSLDLYEQQESVKIGTKIGIGVDGFVGSRRENWTPDMPRAFKEPFLSVPWVQILELLGRVPDGTLA